MDVQKLREEYGSPPPNMHGIKMSIAGREYYYKRREPHPSYERIIYNDVYPGLRDANRNGFDFWDESNDRTTYRADIAESLPLLTPKLTKKGDVAKRQPHIPKQSLKWWRAQCAFRGLPVGGSIGGLQDRIRNHAGTGMSSSVKELLEKMKLEYEVKNIEAIEDEWKGASIDVKAKRWPRRFLSETFLAPGGAGEEAITVEVDDWDHGIEEACRQLTLHCEKRRTRDPYGHKCVIVVGTSEQAVRSRSAEVERDAQRAALREKQEREEQEREAHEEFYTQLDLAKSKGKNSKGLWDVSGKWRINCPYIEEQWGQENDEECELDMQFTQPGSDGLVQVFCTFEFIAFTGIMRLVSSQIPIVEDAGFNEDEDDAWNDESKGDHSTPSQFLFRKASLPSSSMREFSFRWRGEETGEGEIQLYSDQELCSLTFESPNALRGTFNSSLTGECEFSGYKEEFDAPQKPIDLKKQARLLYTSDPGHEWNARSEAAYERARVGRWH